MLKEIIKHDWRLLRADRPFFVIVALFALLLAYGVYNGAKLRSARRAAVERSMQSAEEKLQADKNELAAAEAKGITHTPNAPLWVAHPGDRRTQGIGASPSMLAVLSAGQSDLYPATSDEISQYKSKYDLFKNYEQDNPANLLTGRFDLSFVIVFLLPLLILALTFNLISGEREQGTLALTLAQPVSLRAFVTGKVLARFSLVLAVTLGVALTGVLLSGVNWNASGTVARLLLWTVAVTLYAAFWFAAGVFVAARGYVSATNAATLIGLWLLLVVILPALLNVAVSIAHPLPSRLALTNSTRQAENEASQLEQQLLGKYFGDHPELSLPEKRDEDSLFYVNYIVVAQDRERRIAPLIEDYERRLAEQQAFINRYRFLSPAIVMQEAVNDLAGTGRAHHDRFVAQTRAYFDRWRAFITPLMFRRALLTSADYDRIPRFTYNEEPFYAVLRRTAPPLAAMILFPLALGWLGLRALRRYPIT